MQMSKAKGAKSRHLYTLWVHDTNFSPEELVINSEFFPAETQVGDILEIFKPNTRDKRLYLRVGAITSVKANLQLSIKDSIAPTFELANRDEVVANIVPRDSVLLDFVELTFKDQLISRSDMWRLKLYLQNQCIYVNKNISFGTMRAQVKDLLSNGSMVSSGLISDRTKFIFRSRSAEYILFFQMTKEMWDFAPEDGQLYFEKAVEGFLPQLWEKWQQTGANHSVSVIFFSRTFYPQSQIANAPDQIGLTTAEREHLMTDWAGRSYHDFYTIIALHERITDLAELKRRLKTKFLQYPKLVNWKRTSSVASTIKPVRSSDSLDEPQQEMIDDEHMSETMSDTTSTSEQTPENNLGDGDDEPQLSGENSSADTCNFLEAISLGQTMFDRRRYIDPDLTKSGQTIVVVSAGTGIYHVDAALNQDVKQRMVDNGTGCDLVCLTKPPLHVVPLFVLHYLPGRFLPRMNAGSADPSVPGGLAASSSAASAVSIGPGPSSMLRKPGFDSQSNLAASKSTIAAAGMTGGVSSAIGSAILSTSAANRAQFPQPGSSFSQSFNVQTYADIANLPPEQQQLWAHLPTGPVYKMAHWMFLFFWESARKDYGEDDPVDLLAATRLFVPTCRVPGLPFKPLLKADQIVVPFRVSRKNTNSSSTNHQSLSSSNNAVSQPSPPSSPPMEGTLTRSISTATMEDHDAKVFLAGEAKQPAIQNQPTPASSHSSTNIQQLSSRSKSFATTDALANLPKSRSSASNFQLEVHSATVTPASKRALRTSGVFPKDAESIVAAAAAGSASVLPRNSSNLLRKPTHQRQGSTASSPEFQPGQQFLSSIRPSLKSGAAAQSSPNKKAQALPFSNITSINPFNHNPESSAPAPSSNRARWSHIFPRANMLQELFDADSFGPHWKSLSQPGALPLTTGYMPSQTSLNKDFEEYPHTLGVIPEDCIYGENVDDLFKELVSQRLLFGYQIVDLTGGLPAVNERSIGSGIAAAITNAAASAPSTPAPKEVSSLDEKKKLRYVLSTGYSYHKLGFDSLTQNVEVKRYHRKKAVSPQTRPMQYKYFLYPLRSETRQPRDSAIGYQAMVHYKWNHIDQLIAGYVYDFFDTLIFWRLNLMLVPTAATPQAASAAAFGFERFKDIVTQRIAKNVMDDDFTKFSVTVVTPAPQPDSANATSPPAASAALEPSNIRGILSGLQANVFGERKSKFNSSKTVPSGCFGGEAIDWISRNVAFVARPGASSNTIARDLFQNMFKSGYLTDLDITGPPQGAPIDQNHLYALSELASPAFLAGNQSQSTPLLGKRSAAAPPPKLTQRTVRLEMERTKTDRTEWVNLKYDTVFNPDVVYEMELQWLVGTGGVVLDFFNAMIRRAKANNLQVCLIPVVVDKRSVSSQHPFFASTKLAFNFARLSDPGRTELISHIVSRLDFLPRKVSGQYIHRSGSLLLEVKADAFEWTVNMADAASGSSQATQDLIRKLVDVITQVDSAPIDADGKVQPQFLQQNASPAATTPLTSSSELGLSRSATLPVGIPSVPTPPPPVPAQQLAALLAATAPATVVSVGSAPTDSTPILARRPSKPPMVLPPDSAPVSPHVPHVPKKRHPHSLSRDTSQENVFAHVVPHADETQTAAVADPEAQPQQPPSPEKPSGEFARNVNSQAYWFALGGGTGRPSRPPGTEEQPAQPEQQ